MKKTYTNGEIESIFSVMNKKNSFLYTAKMPAQIRQAIRVNRKVLAERMKIYQEGRSEIFDSYLKNGHATLDGDNIKVEEQYRAAIVHELSELASVVNTVEVEGIKKEILEPFLNSQELTMAEEDALLLFLE